MKVGTDIIEIERISKFYNKYGLCDKLFTTNEIDEFLNIHNNKRIYELFAGKFCAKEAVSKAFGYGIGKIIKWKDIEIVHNENNVPIVKIYGKLKEIFDQQYNQIEISISHSDNYAVATCILI